MPTPATEQAQRAEVVTQNSSKQTLEEIADLLPGTAPVQERIKQIIQQTRFQGPIPPPEIFREYGNVVKDAPERILKVFEQDSAHARELQMGALNAQKADNRRVHWMAFGLIGGGYVLSLAFAMMDKDILAGIVLSTTIIGTVTAFFQGRRNAENPSDSPSDAGN